MQFDNQFKYPSKNLVGYFFNFLLNNFLFLKLKRFVFYPFSFISLRSDIKNVVFLNWLVPYEKIKHLVPEHVKLKSYNGNVLFTILTYEHGNFRPAIFKNLKLFFGSPLQSNWRFYAENNAAFGVSEPTVYFIKNVMSGRMYSFGSRIMSNILQSHLPTSFVHIVTSTAIQTVIKPGESSSPDLQIDLEYDTNWSIPKNMQRAFPHVRDLLSTICDQDYAISNQPEKNFYTIGKISLKFDQVDIHPLIVKNFKSEWLKDIVSGRDCFAFVIKKLNFLTLGERNIIIK